MTPWHAKGTREAIERVHGFSQLELARPCLRSLYDRQMYAQFHYQRAKSTFKRYTRKHLKDKEFLPISMGIEESDWNRFTVVIRKVGADLTACIQSLHAIPDILASAVYYSLALDRTIKPAKGRYVNHKFVTTSLDDLSLFGVASGALRMATNGGAFRHLAALANQSKHYSIVFPALQSEMIGSWPEQHTLAFPSFTAGGKSYPQVNVSELIPPMCAQMSKSVLEVGHAIDAYLQGAS